MYVHVLANLLPLHFSEFQLNYYWTIRKIIFLGSFILFWVTFLFSNNFTQY